jgi:Protein of unknown function (DUF4235)
MDKLLNRAMSTAISVLGGMVAAAIFRRIWRVATREDEAPSATDERRSWPEILIAAALEGAIFAVIRAVLDRGTATAARELTGSWPGEGAEGAAAETEQAT